MIVPTSIPLHDDLRRKARNAIVAYMHHMLYDATQKTAPGVLHAAAEHCLDNSWGIVDKAIKITNRSNDGNSKP